MYKSIITACLLVASICAMAQAPKTPLSKKPDEKTEQPTFKLPPTVKIELTSDQVIAISNKLDSLMNLAIQTNLPSLYIQQFNLRTKSVFSPMWKQVNNQLVRDTTNH